MQTRIYAPALLCAILASSALTAVKITDGLRNLDIAPGTDFAFGRDGSGGLMFTLRDESVLRKLGGVERPTVDVSADDPRFFQPEDNGRYSAVISYDSFARMLMGTKTLSRGRWDNIVGDLVKTARISSMPAPAMHKQSEARAAA